jgi:uncharacterized protein
MPRRDAFFPGRAPIDAYGNGGFRFADMSHCGSLMLLPSGIYGWDAAACEDLTEGSFERPLAEAAQIEFLLLGTGVALRPLRPALARSLRERGLRVEVMDTGAAARTYNVVLAEDRAVAAALIAVD